MPLIAGWMGQLSQVGGVRLFFWVSTNNDDDIDNQQADRNDEPHRREG
jgi:hypothetical protein